MKKLITIVLVCFNSLSAQLFFPLEVGNKWFYEDYVRYWNEEPSIDSSLVIEVLDTVTMSNGYQYFKLTRNPILPGEYFRVDTNCIFGYDEEYDLDVKLIDFEWPINERHYLDDMFSWHGLSTVELINVDTSYFYGDVSYDFEYRLDGLILSYLTFSHKYGPIFSWSPGEPPGTSFSYDLLIGCILGKSTYGTIVSVEDEKRPSEFSLSQNYPNPFNPSTTIKFTIPVETGHAPSLQTKVVVYDVLGREIKTLLNKQLQPGSYEVEFDGSNLTSGVYFYVLESGKTKLSRKMLLLK